MTHRFQRALFILLLAFAAPTAGAQTFFHSDLTPDQETAAVTSSASGTAAFLLTDEGLRFQITVDGLSGDISGAHFHRASMGVSGGVVRAITADFSGTTAAGVWTTSDAQPLTAELVTALHLGELYVNIHTAANGGGEIRGQVLPATGFGLSADLTADQEPHDVTSTARGTAQVTLTATGAIYYVSVDGLSGAPTGAHFHSGAMGVGGGVVRAITSDFVGGTAFGVWTPTDDQPLTPELRQSLATGSLYVNVHTAANGAGEIRGQVMPSSGWAFGALLDGAQETTPVTTAAHGTALVLLSDAGAVFHVSVDGLSGPITGAHFHQAATGTSGGVVRAITADFNGQTASGLWSPKDAQPLTPELVRAMLRGELYLNVHTAANPSGEIRGQVEILEGTAFVAAMTPAQETHDVTQDAAGTAVFVLTDEGLAFEASMHGLSGAITGAHFHQAAAGVSGGVVRAVTADLSGTKASGMWTASDSSPLTPELIEALFDGSLYLNVHTAANGGGEIRGQVVLAAGTQMVADLTAAQETHEVTQDARGTATLTLTPHGLAYRVTVAGLSGEISGAHFHQGAAGVGGGVVRAITDDFSGTTASGLWTPTDAQPLTDELRAALLQGDLYLNIHTAANGAGEIRGQVHASGAFAASTAMDPDQEPHTVVSAGRGTAFAMLTPSGIPFAATVSDLTGSITGAHFHNGPAGQGGGVVRAITDSFTGNTASGAWMSTDGSPLSFALIGEYLAGNLYLNVHTLLNGAGEIRGQLLAGDAVVTGLERTGDDAIPTGFSLNQNYPNPFNPETTIRFDLPASGPARLAVYDMLGRQVAVLADGLLAAGTYEFRMDASRLPSGTYVYRLTNEGRSLARVMQLIR